MNMQDEEIFEHATQMKSYSGKIRKQAQKVKYFPLGEALDELKSADGAGDKTIAGAKLVGKSLFNTGRFVVGECLPEMLEGHARNAEKLIKNKNC